MNKKRKIAGFAYFELPVVIACIGIVIAVILPVAQGLRQGIRNGFNVQELIGTVVINVATGLFILVVFMIAMFLLCTTVVFLSVLGERIRKQITHQDRGGQDGPE